jgi:PAS domain S-box-containing protein
MDDLSRIFSVTEGLGAAIQNFEKLYKMFFDNILDVIYCLDRDFRVIQVSPSVERILGYKPEELVGKPFPDLNILCPEYLDKAFENIMTVFSGERISSAEYEFFAKDGSRKYGEVTGSPLIKNGEVIGVMSVARDITDRKIAEASLLESQARLKLMSDLLEKSSQGFCVWYPDGRIDFINSAYCNLLGYTKDELSQIHWDRHLTPPEYHQREARELALLLKTGKAARYEKEYIRKDGTRMPVELTVDSVVDETNNQILSYCAIVNDLTHRRRMEKALRDSETQMRQIIEFSPIGIGIALDGKYVYANHSFITTFGYDSFDKIAGRPIEQLYPSEFEPRVRQMNQDCLSGKSAPIHYDCMGVRQDGSQFEISIWLTRIEYNGKQATMTFIADISAEKKLEAQLLHAQKMEAIGTLAGGVAHDFNNILTTIIGNAEMSLMQIHKDHPYHEAFSEIKKAAETGTSLTRQLLTLGRKQRTHIQSIDLNQLIGQTEKMLRRLLKENITLHTRYAPDLRCIMADPTQVEQVLLNLSINAADAMPLGGRLTIETENSGLDSQYFIRKGVEPKSGEYVRITVTDSGHGMEKDVQARIFEPFFTTKERGKGTGLGLATVYSIVKQSGGYIWVDSEPGKGTRFTIDWPAATSEHTIEPGQIKAADKQNLKGTETILLVEDEDGLRNFIFQVLKKYGYTVMTAQNGKKAMEMALAHAGEIDLIITDLIMPEMGGKEFSEKLHEQGIKSPILFMSGYPGDGFEHPGTTHEPVRFMQKPFPPKELITKVRGLLDKK